MKHTGQTVSGLVWEFELAYQLAQRLGLGALDNAFKQKSKASHGEYLNLAPREKSKLELAANSAVEFLLQNESRLNNAESLELPKDIRGKQGDVRDIVIHTSDGNEIGISAKHRHKAVKHSRLSAKIDFGAEWYGVPCSAEYWERIHPIFFFLASVSKKDMAWNELGRAKKDEIYVTVNSAFIDEAIKNAIPEKLLRYLLGRHDYYKVMKDNGTVTIESFNMDATLEWGKVLPMPTKIVEFKEKENSKTTATMVLDKGWEMQFRIHSAKSMVEPSLKFDINLVGVPPELTQHNEVIA